MLISPFGDMLKAFRKRKRLSQRALAELLGVHHNTIWSWEQGNYPPERKSIVLELGRLLGLSEAEARQLLEASLTALSPHWSVPYQRNVFFTGRGVLLDQLHQLLHTDQAVALTQSYALYGLGGIGKTQIALEYAYRYALEYSAIFWIEGETVESILASLGRIAGHLQLPERGDSDRQRMVAAVQHWLTTNGTWLLIWDNVEDPELLQHFLPPARQGATLITTCRSSLGTLAHSLELSPMTLDEGAAFVLRRAHLNKEMRSDESKPHPSEWGTAQELVKVMGGLPLALDQAGAYIEEAGCGLSDYLQRYQQQRAPLLGRRGTLGRDHPHPVTTTFRLAYEQVRQQHSLAADLLCLCAFLAPEGIPEEIFLDGTAASEGTADPFVTDLYQFDQAIVALRNFSLVQRQSETQTLSLHRLVQVILQDQMSERDHTQWQQRVVHLLNAAFPPITSDSGTEIWQPCERLLPHVMTCAAALPACLQNQEFAHLLLKAADYLDQRSQYERAKSLYQQALQIQIQLFGLEHPNVASLQSKLAYLYRLLGDYEQAEPLFQSAERVLEQALGPEHPEVAYPLEGLAMVYYEQGQYKLAESLQQRALQIREQARGLEHPEVALSLIRLGNVYFEQGKYDLAEGVYQRSLQIRERVWGQEHFRLAGPLSNLGDLYRKQGQYELAESLFQRAARIEEQALGPDHLDVAFTLVSLADLYREWGRCKEADQLYRRAFAIFEQALGSEHHIIAYPLQGLALLFREQGHYEQAEALFQRALQIRERRLGQDHPETAQTLHDLAVLYQLQGTMSKAYPRVKRALQICLRSLGDSHPKTIASRELAAQLEEARGIMQD
ncbi:tetratricopeptide repeat protein [Ktedonobacter sp. SOSP1-52]|uniref:FxSxx-COOH system tetratricopeptide repeat protein n=1 Tax=Ktedonobacter sp. SOSP1-52 TaxID=2778366 RepID=UPI0019164F86|nr:FxSxx-COOH system tetratricopeptide repeat protein [Ktedonobacter sp. SOSP1-52]GHO71687.1 tetratricopeptide repeat protein [Ktedonobacter sp. SOSP1-52]